MTFTIYIRTFIESFQYILLCSTSEIYTFSVQSAKSIFLLLTSFTILAVTLIAVILVLLHYCKMEVSNSPFFGELYSGLKMTKAARAYTFVWMLRRILFVGWLIFAQRLGLDAVLGPMVGVQVSYIVFLVV